MNRILIIFAVHLVVFPVSLFGAGEFQVDGGAETQPVGNVNGSMSSALNAFTCEPVFSMQKLWKGRGGTSIVTAQDGSVVAFQSMGSNKIRRSNDGGATWSTDIEIGRDATHGNAVVDESTGDILYVKPAKKLMWRSRDHGATWLRETIENVSPDGFGLTPNTIGAMQPGITLMFGSHKGRLLMPARIQGSEYSNDVKWRPYHYSTAIYSDDRGTNWHTSKPFPVFGTGEGALAEISDGRILYNSREHMSRGNRFLAWSDNGGDLWIDAYRSADLPDGPRGSSYGCMGGMVRLPIQGLDILLYSNLDTNAGVMPDRTGASITDKREKITVWVSFDGGKSWPVKRLVFDGPSAYSNLAVGRAGTPSEGKIYLLFEGGPGGRRSAINVAVFNLSWLLNNRDLSGLLNEYAGVSVE
jgi:sialidase-1